MKSLSLIVHQFPCLDDNYGYLVHDRNTGETAAIDTPCAHTYGKELEKLGWGLTHIFNTHHHFDHVGGNMELKEKYPNCKVYGPMSEGPNVPGMDIGVIGEDTINFGNCVGSIIDVGGHTKGHIAYYFDSENKVFCGDALFTLGCGKMFEGTAEQFWSSLKRLRSLPDETEVFCAHEYTMGNAKFAKSVEPGNKELLERIKVFEELRSKGEPTVPCMLGDEKRTNPFLRGDVSDEIRSNVGAEEGDDDSTVFGKIRRAKDTFRG